MNKRVYIFALLFLGAAAIALAAVPSYIPVYPGAKVIEGEMDEGYGVVHQNISEKTTVAKVGEWYLQELKKKGWSDAEKVEEEENYIGIEAVLAKKNLWISTSIQTDGEKGIGIDCEWGIIENDEDEGGDGD